MTSDSESPDIPPKFHNVLVFGALSMYGFTFIDDTRKREVDAQFVRLLDEMREMANPGKDSHTVIQPWDLRPSSGIRFGPQFPGRFGHIISH